MPNTPASPAAQLRGTLALTGASVDHLVSRAHEWHREIAKIPFGLLKPVPGVNAGSEPIRVIHNAITNGIYALTRGISAAVFKGGELALEVAEKQRLASPLPARAHAVRDDAISAVNGVVGDYMLKSRNPLAVRFGFYKEGRRLALTPDALRESYPEAGSRVAVFVHGLACNESVWKMFATPEQPPYDERIPQDLGYTALHVRYNSGLHISQNGLSLARQMHKLVTAWRVRISEIVFIGHSMGGLVCRSAAAYGLKHRAAWTDKVTHVVCLGSPHRGSGLERVTHAATTLMEAFSLTRPVARMLKIRSRGILDLRHGYVSDSDWRGRNPHTQYDPVLTPTPPLPGAKYHFIGATMGSSENHVLEKTIGDGLVRIPSSTATELAGSTASAAVLFRAHHLTLLNHPAIYDQLRQRLAS